MIRTSHVIAAFVGVVFAAWLMTGDSALAQTPKPPLVLWTALLFGLMWECIVRLSSLLRGFLGRKRAD